jgi:transposase
MRQRHIAVGRDKSLGLRWQGGDGPQIRQTPARTADGLDALATGGLPRQRKDLHKAPSARRASWWLLGPTEELDKEQRAFVEQLCCLCPQPEAVRELARGFRKMVSERRVEELDAWLDAAKNSEVAEIENFGRALRRD